MRIQNEGTGKSSWWMLNPEGGKNGKSPRRRAASMDNNSKLSKSRGRATKKKVQSTSYELYTQIHKGVIILERLKDCLYSLNLSMCAEEKIQFLYTAPWLCKWETNSISTSQQQVTFILMLRPRETGGEMREVRGITWWRRDVNIDYLFSEWTTLPSTSTCI